MSLFRPTSAATGTVTEVESELLPTRQPTRRQRADHSSAPYLEALQAYADRDPGRFHVPGHKGGLGTDPELLAALGANALSLDVPMVIHGIDVGPSPTPLEEAQAMAADAWGAKRTYFLSPNGATQQPGHLPSHSRSSGARSSSSATPTPARPTGSSLRACGPSSSARS
jgi:hypothetical protein